MYIRFWALNVTYTGPTSYIRSQFFEYLRESLYKHALEHLEAAGPEKEHLMGRFLFFLL